MSYFGSQSKSDTHKFVGIQKPIKEIEEIIKKEQDLKDLVSAISSKIKPKYKPNWEVGRFEARAEPTPKSHQTLLGKLEKVGKCLSEEIETLGEEKRHGDNYEQLVELASYCLGLLLKYESGGDITIDNSNNKLK